MGFLDLLKKDFSLLWEGALNGYESLLNNSKVLLISMIFTLILIIFSAFVPIFAYLIPVIFYFFPFFIYRIDLLKFGRSIARGMLFYYFSFILIFYLMILASSYLGSFLSIILSLVFFAGYLLLLFIPVYMAKAGSSFMKSLYFSFNFVLRTPFKTTFYLFTLVFISAIVSTLLGPIGGLIFILLQYVVYLFTIAYWELAK